ncbi:MAG: gliding motility-associated C-terminal domain-containing protein [Chitinophagaceae bacterium]
MRYLMIVWALLCPTLIYAQNLVPNPSFEAYNKCPTDFAQVGDVTYTVFPSVKSWAQATFGIASYFNECNNPSTNHIVGVPANFAGYQYARTGKGYCDIELISGYIDSTRQTINTVFVCKYIQTKLLKPLEKGKQYLVAYYVVNANTEEVYVHHCCKYVAELGSNVACANLSVNRPFDSTITKEFFLTPHIKPDSVITTDSFWTRICGIYTAQGGEEWLTIGNFLAPKDVRIAPLNPQVDTAQPGGCRMYIDDVSVEPVNSLIFPNASKDTTVCTKPIDLKLHAEGGAGKYRWNTGDSTYSIRVTDTGTFWFACDLGCGMVSDTIRVRYQNFEPLLPLPDTAICYGDTLQISIDQIFNHYQWSTGDTAKSTLIIKPGKYILKVEDACGLQRDTFVVAAKPPSPLPLARDTAFCEGLEDPRINIVGSGLKWYECLQCPPLNQQPTINTNNLQHQVLYVSQNTNGCESGKAAINISIDPLPTIKTNGDTLFCEGNIGKIGIVTDSFSYKYLWNTGDTMVRIYPKVQGIYTLSAINNCGEKSNNIGVKFSPCTNCLYFPNAFTPNNDGKNDYFRVHTLCPVYHYQLRIYNRWGQQIYNSIDINDAWDGTFGGKNLELGVYFYQISYQASYNVVPEYFKGTLDLLR